MENLRHKAEIKERLSPYAPYIEISLDNLLYNLTQIRSTLSKDVGVIAVIKDCAYGCGSAKAAYILEQHGKVEFFAVARPQEAFALKKAGINTAVLILGQADNDELRRGAQQNIVFSINDLRDIELFKSSGLNIRFHLHIDTGMNRMGLLTSEIGELIDKLKSAPYLHLDGVYTHMACADEPNTSTVKEQFDKFKYCIDQLTQAGFSPPHIHYGNSAAFIRFGVQGCTLVRPGIALYGCKPDPFQNFDVSLKPVTSLVSRIVKMKKVPAASPVSYGGNYITEKETWIATIALGYAHGLPRFLSGKGEVLIGGNRYRIAGNVTMDYIMVDAGPNPAISAGDEVVAMGSQGKETITPDQIAIYGNTIGYEILCNLGTSIDRFYTLNGKVIHHDPGIIF
ncbi:MAG: alanine racemase [Chitinispirillales bacterium]|jgi:alanine racemase|nr:alanine racemase [Chitinispirillales bacterium]